MQNKIISYFLLKCLFEKKLKFREPLMTKYTNDDIFARSYVNNLERQLQHKFAKNGGYSRQLHRALGSIQKEFHPNGDFQKSVRQFTKRGQRFFGHFPDFK